MLPVRLCVLLVAGALLGMATAPPAGAASLKYVISKEKTLKAGETATQTAKCPDGSSVTGGGMAIAGGTTATEVRSTFPLDTGDPDVRPDDAWRTVALSRSAGDRQMVTTAICSQTGRFSYVERNVLVGAPQVAAEATCPISETVAGGGVALPTAYNALNISGIYPFDDNGDAKADDGWEARVNNDTGELQGMSVYAVCARSGKYRYRSRIEAVGAGSQGGAAVPCPNGTRVTAGGADGNSGDLLVALARSMPYQDGGTQPDDGWQPSINNNASSASADVVSWAICRR